MKGSINMAQITSAYANKLLKHLNDELQRLVQAESTRSVYTEIEGIKPIVPEYDFDYTRKEIAKLMRRITALKHEINVFNAKTIVPETDMTIDCVLIKMAMLNKEKQRLETMSTMQKRALKANPFGRQGNQVEYAVANFDVGLALIHYTNTVQEINRLQLQLDIVNNTYLFEHKEEEE